MSDEFRQGSEVRNHAGFNEEPQLFIEREFHRFPEFVSWASLFIFPFRKYLTCTLAFVEVIHSCRQVLSLAEIVFFSSLSLPVYVLVRD